MSASAPLGLQDSENRIYFVTKMGLRSPNTASSAGELRMSTATVQQVLREDEAQAA